RCQAEKQGSPKRGSLAKKPPAKAVGQQDAAVNRQCGYQASRPVMHAEKAITQADQPIEQGRLIEIGLALQIRDYPFAAQEHFPRDLRIAALIRLEEVKRHTRVEQCAGENQQKQEGSRPQTLIVGPVPGKKNLGP